MVSDSFNPYYRAATSAIISNQVVSRVVQRHGMQFGGHRFVAGTTFDETLIVIKELIDCGFLTYTFVLGQALYDQEAVEVTVSEHEMILDQLANEGLATSIAINLTQFGLEIQEEFAYANTLRIIERAAATGNFVRISMEESPTVDATLRIYRRLRESGFDNVGVVLQSYLYRTDQDLLGLLDYQPNIRLVKGGYLEPNDVAYPQKADIDVSYLRLVKRSLSFGGYTAIATHDHRIIEYVLEYTDRHGISPDRYEFQMLLGIRPSLQQQLVDQGHRLRIAVPYGPDWYIYFMRRLAERPANVAFLMRNLLEI